jgi:hypothetical protein
MPQVTVIFTQELDTELERTFTAIDVNKGRCFAIFTSVSSRIVIINRRHCLGHCSMD